MNATPTAHQEREAYDRAVELLRPLRRERECQQVTDAGTDAQALDAIADLVRASEPVLGVEEDITAPAALGMPTPPTPWPARRR